MAGAKLFSLIYREEQNMLKKRFSTILTGNEVVEIDMLRVMLQLPNRGGASSKDAELFQVMKDCTDFVIEIVRQETGGKIVSYQQIYNKIGKPVPESLNITKTQKEVASAPDSKAPSGDLPTPLPSPGDDPAAASE